METTEKSNELKAAEWLVVGFVKCWGFKMLDIRIMEETGKHSNEYAFLPDSIYWRGNAPVRGYIAQNFPKLNEFLIKATPQQQIAVAAKICNLKCKGDRPKGALNQSEYAEVRKDKKAAIAETASFRLSRESFTRSNGTGWKTCK